MKFGSNDVANVMSGSSQVQKVMQGTNLVWEHTPPATHAFQIEVESPAQPVFHAEGGTLVFDDLGNGWWSVYTDDPVTWVYIEDDSAVFDNSQITAINLVSCPSSVVSFERLIGSSNNMPNYCTTVDIAETFDSSSVTTMYRMFQGHARLETLTGLENLDVSSVTNMDNMFANMEYRTNGLDLPSSWETVSLTDMYSMFARCDRISHVDISFFDLSNLTTMAYMFNRVGQNVKTNYVYLPAYAPAANMAGLFSSASITCLNRLDTTAATDRSGMFNNATIDQPDATAQADLADADGASWVNPGACP